MDLGGVIRAGAWTVGGLLALVVAAYLAFVVVNWKDEPPSADAARMAASVRDRPAVDDDSNAFVHLLGLAAPPDADALALGRERKAWMEAFDRDAGTQAHADFPGDDADYRAARPRDVADLASACPGADCEDVVRARPDVLVQWLESERWLLERYRRMIDTPAWREAVPEGPNAPTVGFSRALDAQELHLLDAHRHAVDGNTARANDLLERDIAFWRRVLAASDNLLSKMIAVAAVERHFELGGMALRQLPIDSLAGAVPPSWHRPTSDAERSLSRALAGELHSMPGYMAQAAFPERLTGWESLSTRLLHPGFQPQATVNVVAAQLASWSAVSERPYLEFAQALAATGQAQADASARLGVYNVLGTLLVSAGGSAYADFVARAADVEGMRRAALLAVTLRAAGVEPAGAEAVLRDADLRNPYTAAPFAWDAANGSIVFQGLEHGERGRFAAPL